MEKQRVKKEKKKLKRWVKWVIGIASFLVVIALIFTGVIYYYIKSIDIEDIASRHSGDVVADDSGENKSEPKKLPAIIEKPVEKASQLIGGEKIDSADALDVAAILLNSGLSLKQISYLQGNATTDLPVEEKQKIRDLLLTKLSDEERKLLSSITKQYGIALNILNPDFPIEWVGERDPEKIKEHDEAWKKINQQSDSLTKSTDSGTRPNNKPTETTKPTELEKRPAVELSTDLKKVKQSIDSKTETQLASLSSTCEAKSNAILQQIVGNAGGVTLEELQNKYLEKIMEAEGSCDAQFQGIVSQAASGYADAGIDSSAMPDWNAKYEASKQSVRASAISAIAKAIK